MEPGRAASCHPLKSPTLPLPPGVSPPTECLATPGERELQPADAPVASTVTGALGRREADLRDHVLAQVTQPGVHRGPGRPARRRPVIDSLVRG